MRSALNFYYNLYPEELFSQDNFYYFNIGENKYYLAPFNNDENSVEKIYETLKKRGIKTNEIIFNKDGKIATIIDNQAYAIIMVNCLENALIELEEFQNIEIFLPVSNWGEIWGNKLDYYSYQVSERALKKEAVLNSFSYYLGLGENAIEYYNLVKLDGAQVAIQHRRMHSKNYEINYWNPINMVIDYNIRDLAEYIKFSFFEDDFNIDRIINYINKKVTNVTMINLLYARLLFPSYYFDLYDKVLGDEENELVLIKIIDKSKEFEEFLRNFYIYYSKMYPLIRVEWIIKT